MAFAAMLRQEGFAIAGSLADDGSRQSDNQCDDGGTVQVSGWLVARP